MDLTSWIQSTSLHPNLNLHPNASPYSPPSSLATSSTHKIQTPSASNWTDTSIHDGAGSDEGDTFKYECRICRFICASVEELCAHLVTGQRHVVCPVCLREFAGENRLRSERERWGHIQLVHSNLGSRRDRAGSERRDDYRAVSKDAAELSLTIGLRLPADEGEDRSEHSLSAISAGGKKDPPSTPGVNGVLDELSPYYHWEPDMLLLTKFADVDVNVLREEREREMQWLRGFEGV